MSSVSFGSVALHSSNESAGKVSKMQKKKMHYFFSIIDNHVWCRKPSPVSLWFTLPFSFELADGMTAQFEFHLDFNQLFVVLFFLVTSPGILCGRRIDRGVAGGGDRGGETKDENATQAAKSKSRRREKMDVMF